ncbi:tetratricopeptide repeat protein [uncultured Desulfosarcina sp.]|uniref:tetratricopeptide repeat protein n=1 Tax=uncultured Desulfosarcina sp. TaxID=218289 RepID=UPI0029C7574E|nr:tetratricopeptide repeat protein [uncultured Desulfosarcina sp.]
MSKQPLTKNYLRTAVEYQRGGDFDEARKWLHKALEISPNHPDVLRRLGLLEVDAGKPDDAIRIIQKVIAIEGGRAEYYEILGRAFFIKNALVKAIACYERAIRKAPGVASAYLNLFKGLTTEGMFQQAEKVLKDLLSIMPDSIQAYQLMAEMYGNRMQLEKAQAILEKALRIEPENADCHFNLAVVCQRRKNHKKALVEYKKVLEIEPGLADAHINIGLIYKSLQQYRKAIHHFQSAYEKAPGKWEICNNLGNVYLELGEVENALRYYGKALQIDPENKRVLLNTGSVYLNLAEYKTAIDYYEKALNIDQNDASIHYHMGLAYQNVKEPEKAVASFEKAIRSNPGNIKAKCFLYHQLQHICQWEKLDLLGKEIDTATKAALLNNQPPAEVPFLNLMRKADPRVNLSVARAHSKKISLKVAVYRPGFLFNKKRKKKITIGYLSNRFRNTASAHLTLGLYGNHDRKDFNINCYSYGIDDGSMYRKRIVAECDKFVDIKDVGHLEAAKKIFEDRVDILVDMKGFTRSNRLEICALRPAPIQVNYLGFTGTTGADFMDYIITDKVVTPKVEASCYSERFIYMPNSYMIQDGCKKISETKLSRADFGLPENDFVFCNFNLPYKIDPAIFNRWMEILRNVPNSVLWLLDGNKVYKKSIVTEAEKRGVREERLRFTQPLPIANHLNRHQLADLVLDTATVNGHTTTSDALWAGVGVLTIKGNHFMSRVSASLLSAIGLPELITASGDDYVSLAIRIANNKEEFNAIREKLLRNRLKKPLFDTNRFVRDLEQGYRMVWEQYLSGGKPIHITIPSEK